MCKSFYSSAGYHNENGAAHMEINVSYKIYNTLIFKHSPYILFYCLIIIKYILLLYNLFLFYSLLMSNNNAKNIIQTC